MTHPTRRLFALAVTLGATLVAACSGTGGPPASSAAPTFPPVATASASPSVALWPGEWPAVVCEARGSLDDATSDVTQAVAAAADNQKTAAGNFATQASSTARNVGDALDAVTDWDAGRGVSVNLRAAATHLDKAATQLMSWSDRPTAAKLTAAKKELAAAKTNLTRATTNQKSLAKATGFACPADESAS